MGGGTGTGYSGLRKEVLYVVDVLKISQPMSFSLLAAEVTSRFPDDKNLDNSLGIKDRKAMSFRECFDKMIILGTTSEYAIVEAENRGLIRKNIDDFYELVQAEE